MIFKSEKENYCLLKLSLRFITMASQVLLASGKTLLY